MACIVRTIAPMGNYKVIVFIVGYAKLNVTNAPTFCTSRLTGITLGATTIHWIVLWSSIVINTAGPI